MQWEHAKIIYCYVRAHTTHTQIEYNIWFGLSDTHKFATAKRNRNNHTSNNNKKRKRFAFFEVFFLNIFFIQQIIQRRAMNGFHFARFVYFRLRFYGRNEMSNRDRMERLCRYSCLLFESIWIIFVTDLVCACGRGSGLCVWRCASVCLCVSGYVS